jgi:uncharacterized caspase-like protein
LYAGGAGVIVALLICIGIGFYFFSTVQDQSKAPASPAVAARQVDQKGPAVDQRPPSQHPTLAMNVPNPQSTGALPPTGTRRGGQRSASGPPRTKVVAKEAGPGRKLAFLVGVKSYDHAELKNLDFPENDVKELSDVLKGQGFTVTLMSTSAARTDTEHFPDADNIRQQLSAILKGASKRDLILVGLAGHGLQPLNSSQSYFCPHDANPSERDGEAAHPETLLSTGEILTQLRDSGIGQKLLLVDACRNDPGVRGGRRGGGVVQVDVSALPDQTGILLSCARGEFSFESKSFGTGHGAFFFQVIEGLNGAAKDEDGDCLSRSASHPRFARCSAKRAASKAPTSLGI